MIRKNVVAVTVEYADGTIESWGHRADALGRVDHVKTYVEHESKRNDLRRPVEYLSIDLPVDVGAAPNRGNVVVAGTDVRHALDLATERRDAYHPALAALAAALLHVPGLHPESATVPG